MDVQAEPIQKMGRAVNDRGKRDRKILARTLVRGARDGGRHRRRARRGLWRQE
jgi:hypothetical protein